MDPIIDGEWLGSKNESIEETQNVGNIARSWILRETGINPPNTPSNKTVLENVAEDILVQKPLKIRCCDLPGHPRSTFLMVFSPDGTKVASTHGNHNVYVSELASGKHVRILKGHPRTPWCVAFHPSHPELIGSGCLGGQVRVWDISSGGSEVWSVPKETVIASIAFHPREQLLVIATYNELYFWDWSHPAPFTSVSTNNINEKVRYVAFDSLGYKLITGISLSMSSSPTSLLQRNARSSPPHIQNYRRRDDSDDSPTNNRPQESPAPTRDVVVNSYQNLVQRYDSLVRNYQRLFMVRHRLTATTPPPNTTDRGTDPMEMDAMPESDSQTNVPQNTTLPTYDTDPVPGPSRQESTDLDGPQSRILNFSALTFESDTSREETSNNMRQGSSGFGSRTSAFQPLNERPRRSSPLPRSTTQAVRLLPNPFSPMTRNQEEETSTSSRTTLFPAYRAVSPPLFDLTFHENSSNNSEPLEALFPDNISRSLSPVLSVSPLPSFQRQIPTDTTTTTTLTNTQSSINPSDSINPPVDAQSINESLDLIRDILRDSGTRLLNLITNMSISTLTRAERRRENASRTHSEGDGSSDSASRPRNNRTRNRLFSSNLRIVHFLSSSSESDSDNPPEVNIFRTRNTSFREDGVRENNPQSTSSSPSRAELPTDRLFFELGDDVPLEEGPEGSGINVSSNSRRFHVRSQSTSNDPSSTRPNVDSRDGRNDNSNFDPNMPSTSRENFWSGGNSLSSTDAFRKVREGVTVLQKHAQILNNLWICGQRISMRELRNMWEMLRRRILVLHRQTGTQDTPSYYSRSLLERCMMLPDMTENSTRSSNRARSNQRSEDRNSETNRDIPQDSATNSNERSEAAETTNNTRTNRTSQTRSSSGGRFSPFARRRLQPHHRWRHEDEYRRRTRNTTSNRLAQRFSNRPRREFARAIEISATRHEIRMRAMQVLSVMFNMMMMCLEERGLSLLIINMLRSLKRALALTCLMLMTNRNNARAGASNNSQNSEHRNRNQSDNEESNGNENANDHDSTHNSVSSEAEEERTRESTNSKTENATTKCHTAQDVPSTSSCSSNSQRWSNRLAVLIAAANRNNSATARSRRELYLESRRLKALHRTNPTAHPLIKKRTLPPVSTLLPHRIPSLRSLPRKVISKVPSRSESSSNEPVAGPSNSFSALDNPNQERSRLPPEVMNEFEHRINLIRIAHMQAVRLRNAARNRYRRLQTIRLYTPSSVREMFSLPAEASDQNQQINRNTGQGNSEQSNNRGAFENRPSIFNRERLLIPVSAHSDSPGQLNGVAGSTGAPVMPVYDLNAPEGRGSRQQGISRIREYVQPIILAQNAMVVDENGNPEGGAGEGNGIAGIGTRRMAGLLDPGIISDHLHSPTHRLQAWDFTKGDTPDIADSSKNVVVQRCKIHNDASIDISKDGRLLVALLPVPRLRNTNHWLGVYSLEWGRLGQCLHTAVLEQSAVSVALSPTARHLAVGLGSRRFASHHARTNLFALLYRLDPLESSSRTGLSPIKELEQTWEQGFTSLNCLRWAPQPGQGLVYANNTGQLIVMS